MDSHSRMVLTEHIAYLDISHTLYFFQNIDSDFSCEGDILASIGRWKTFKKMNREGYEALIPYHNTYEILKVNQGMVPLSIFL